MVKSDFTPLIASLVIGFVIICSILCFKKASEAVEGQRNGVHENKSGVPTFDDCEKPATSALRDLAVSAQYAIGRTLRQSKKDHLEAQCQLSQLDMQRGKIDTHLRPPRPARPGLLTSPIRFIRNHDKMPYNTRMSFVGRLIFPATVYNKDMREAKFQLTAHLTVPFIITRDSALWGASELDLVSNEDRLVLVKNVVSFSPGSNVDGVKHDLHSSLQAISTKRGCSFKAIEEINLALQLSGGGGKPGFAKSNSRMK